LKILRILEERLGGTGRSSPKVWGWLA